MPGSWESKRRGRVPLILLVVGVALAGVFLYNNSDVFTGRPSADALDASRAPSSRPQGAEAALPSDSGSQRDTGHESHDAPGVTSIGGEEAGIGSADTTSADRDLLSVHLANVPCRLLGRDSLIIRVSLVLYFKGDGLKQEILFKREDLKVMIRKVLASRRLSEILVEELRSELKTAVNSILDNGRVEDIEFLDFRPL